MSTIDRLRQAQRAKRRRRAERSGKTEGPQDPKPADLEGEVPQDIWETTLRVFARLPTQDQRALISTAKAMKRYGFKQSHFVLLTSAATSLRKGEGPYVHAVLPGGKREYVMNLEEDRLMIVYEERN